MKKMNKLRSAWDTLEQYPEAISLKNQEMAFYYRPLVYINIKKVAREAFKTSIVNINYRKLTLKDMDILIFIKNNEWNGSQEWDVEWNLKCVSPFLIEVLKPFVNKINNFYTKKREKKIIFLKKKMFNELIKK